MVAFLQRYGIFYLGRFYSRLRLVFLPSISVLAIGIMKTVNNYAFVAWKLDIRGQYLKLPSINIYSVLK